MSKRHHGEKKSPPKKKHHPDRHTFYLRHCILNYKAHKERLREVYWEMQDTGSTTQKFSDAPKGGFRELNGTEVIASRNAHLEIEQAELIEKIRIADKAAHLSTTLSLFVKDGISIRRYGDIHNLNYRQARNKFNEEVRNIAPQIKR